MMGSLFTVRSPAVPACPELTLHPLAQPHVPRWQIHVALWLSSEIRKLKLFSALSPPLHFGHVRPFCWPGAYCFKIMPRETKMSRMVLLEPVAGCFPEPCSSGLFSECSGVWRGALTAG